MGRSGASPEPAPGAGDATHALCPIVLGELARDVGLDLAPPQCATLVAYAQLLRRWNRVHNLTAIASNADLLTHHLLDCLAIVRPIERALARYATGYRPGGTVDFLDAGSGGGLPGIPLAVARPHWRGLLVDAVQKKCAFLQQAKVELQLDNIAVRHARLESADCGQHELIVSRAFASLRDFVVLTQPLLRPGGLWVAMKGRHPEAELAGLPDDVEVLETSTLRVPQLSEQRHLVVLRPAAAVPGPGAPSR